MAIDLNSRRVYSKNLVDIEIYLEGQDKPTKILRQVKESLTTWQIDRLAGLAAMSSPTTVTLYSPVNWEINISRENRCFSVYNGIPYAPGQFSPRDLILPIHMDNLFIRVERHSLYNWDVYKLGAKEPIRIRNFAPDCAELPERPFRPSRLPKVKNVKKVKKVSHWRVAEEIEKTRPKIEPGYFKQDGRPTPESDWMDYLLTIEGHPLYPFTGYFVGKPEYVHVRNVEGDPRLVTEVVRLRLVAEDQFYPSPEIFIPTQDLGFIPSDPLCMLILGVYGVSQALYSPKSGITVVNWAVRCHLRDERKSKLYWDCYRENIEQFHKLADTIYKEQMFGGDHTDRYGEKY